MAILSTITPPLAVNGRYKARVMGSVLYQIKWQASVSNQTNQIIQTLYLSTELFIVVRIYCILKYNAVILNSSLSLTMKWW